ncbi:MAG: helix-turn-helix domain-containing protein [Promethearchaeota archaeon]
MLRTNDNKRFMDVQQLASLLQVKPKTIYDWKHRGYIPHVKLGRLLRFEVSAIEQWISKKSIHKSKSGRII